MASAAIGQGVSGAASGAAIGAQIGAAGGPIGLVGGAVIGGIAGLISGSSADNQFENSLAWAEYNRQSQYNTDIYNIQSGLMIAGINASLALSTGRYNATNIRNSAIYNANMIALTIGYNEELLENELTRTWNNLGLDIAQIEMFRARERGTIVAEQGASGTVIGQGSNETVVVSQMTQEAMDINIVQFGAERVAANISNEIAQGRWQGEVAIQQTMWEGEVAAQAALYNSKVQAVGSLATAVISAEANMYSAKQAFMAGGDNITQAESNFSAQNKQAMISGLFQAGGIAVSGYYANKVIPKAATTSGSLVTTSNYSPKFQSNVYLGQSNPGTSLALGANR